MEDLSSWDAVRKEVDVVRKRCSDSVRVGEKIFGGRGLKIMP